MQNVRMIDCTQGDSNYLVVGNGIVGLYSNTFQSFTYPGFKRGIKMFLETGFKILEPVEWPLAELFIQTILP